MAESGIDKCDIILPCPWLQQPSISAMLSAKLFPKRKKSKDRC